MGKDLHSSIMPFIKSRLEEHQDVVSVTEVSTPEHYLFRLTRRNGMSDVVVLISDCYHFSEFDYYTKPAELNNGGVILIARPEATFPDDTQQHEIEDKIIIGKIGILLGALRKNKYWTYEKPPPKRKTNN